MQACANGASCSLVRGCTDLAYNLLYWCMHVISARMLHACLAFADTCDRWRRWFVLCTGLSQQALIGPSRVIQLLHCTAYADLVMGSLIKNAGGTLAPGGGYVAGRADLVSAVGARLAAPGIGTDAGGVPGTTLRLLFQGRAQRAGGSDAHIWCTALSVCCSAIQSK